MMHVAADVLSWLYANVTGNLIASVIWATPAFIWQHRRITKHHTKQIQAVHDRLDLHFGEKEGPRAEVPKEADRH